ncbi:unnamed protein product [Heligmosomoides polygyrus]|uniref:Pepsin-I3 domain-containing protein n=1 Tax=Heligmosomoides polygyrus TaxID=6339 RepID=A0A183GEL6_HELPZ|nr:unnamed protein product [Heligmosomoides polygyrus]
MDVTFDPNTGAQLADCESSNGNLLGSVSDQSFEKAFIAQDRIAPQRLQGQIEPKCHVFKEMKKLWEASPLLSIERKRLRIVLPAW